MKKIYFILFLLYPLALFSQEYGLQRLTLIFSLSNDELRTLVTSKSTQIKMSEEEIIKISKIIDEKKEEYFKIVDQLKKSIPLGADGKPIGKGDPEINRKRETLSNEVCTSIYKILGNKRYKQFHKTLIDESEKRNMERLKNAGKNTKR